MKWYGLRLAGLFFSVILIHTTSMAHNTRPPRLTVILVIDQFAHRYVDKLYSRLKHGLRYLYDHGVVYTNAHMPHGQPGTATGHAGLNTGTCARYHGFTSNTWYQHGVKVECDDDETGDALVINPIDGSTYDYGKSAQYLMVDGLSDQCALQTEPASNFFAYSISGVGKSRAAIATASKMGKALWIDPVTGMFTSSKAYFDTLPLWLQQFNRTHDINKPGYMKWTPMYPLSPYAYNFFNINNYKYARTHETMMNKNVPVPDLENSEHPYHYFEKMPQANQLILDCAQACIKTYVSRKHRDRLLLWVCLSPLDKVAHQYGSESKEAIDMIYHLDKQIQRFIRRTLRVIGKHEVIFALTADHAVMSIPDLLHDEGLKQAQRIRRVEWIQDLNQKLAEKYGLEKIILSHKSQELVLDPKIMDELDHKKRSAIMQDIKFLVMQEPGIKNVWTYDELVRLPTCPNTFEENIKNQLFKGRSGSIVIQTHPYTVFTMWGEGTSHKTPYDYDTHVPLVIFHPGKFEHRYVRKRVAALQLPNTLAEVINVPKPSASTYDILPDLFDPEYK